jgi:hypothetical protein
MLYALRTKAGNDRMPLKLLHTLPLVLALGGVVTLVAGCRARDPVILPPVKPVQNVLLWTIDAQGRVDTHWVRGNRNGGRIIASRPGLLLAVPGGVYEVEERAVELPTCDCAAWEAAGREGACPAVAAGADVTRLVAVSRLDGEESPITDPPEAEDGNGPAFGELASRARVTASMGPYLFVRIDTRATACGAAHDTLSSELIVFDLVAGGAVDLFTEAERSALAGREQAAAFELFEGDTLVDAARPEDLELTMIAPSVLPGVGLGLRYQFSAGSSFAASDGAWGAYTRSVEVNAAALPASIAPFAEIPEALRTFPPPGEGLAIGGFAPITATTEQLAALERSFAAAEEDADAEGSTRALDP